MADNVHAKMLESLGSLIAFAQTLDMAVLNPPADLTVAALTALRTSATDLQTLVGDSKAVWRTAALDRAEDAEKLASIASQAVALFEARGASKGKVEDARFYVRKLQGKRASPAAEDNPATPGIDESEQSVSASQQSNAAKIATFNEFIDFMEAQTEYVGVTKPGLSIADMRAFIDSISAKHDASMTAAVNLSSERGERDKVFYDNDDSILNRAKRFKKLVGATYGFDSPEYRTANAIPFQKP